MIVTDSKDQRVGNRLERISVDLAFFLSLHLNPARTLTLSFCRKTKMDTATPASELDQYVLQ